jgi:hypothetical protein
VELHHINAKVILTDRIQRVVWSIEKRVKEMIRDLRVQTQILGDHVRGMSWYCSVHACYRFCSLLPAIASPPPPSTPCAGANPLDESSGKNWHMQSLSSTLTLSGVSQDKKAEILEGVMF